MEREGLGRRRRRTRGARRNGRAVLFELTDKLLPAALGEKEGGQYLFEMHVCGKVIGAGADQHDVGRLLHDRAGERDGMARALHIGNRAGPHRFAIHDRRIKLVGAIRCENRATAGVEQRIIFEQLDGAFDSIERRTTLIEHVGSGGERFLEAGPIVSLGFERH